MIRILLTAALIAVTVPSYAAEQRCGWLDNPTPGNWWLTDRDREWTIATQGDGNGEILDAVPDMSVKGWVKTNGSYGYGCACMTVVTDLKAERIVRILAAKPVPLRQCRADRRLPKR